MKKITREQINAETIPFPAVPEQRHIAAELGGRLEAAEVLIARCREELSAIEALPAALLRGAFSSEV